MQRPGRGIGRIRARHRLAIFGIEQQEIARPDPGEVPSPRVHQEFRPRFVDGDAEVVGDRFVHVEPGRPAKCARQRDSLVLEVHSGPAEHSVLSTDHDTVPLFE